MSKKQTVTAILVIIILAALTGFVSNFGFNGQKSQTPLKPYLILPLDKIQANYNDFLASADEPPLGNPHADYTLVEFGDYQCPMCAKLRTTVRDLVDASRGHLRLYFVTFPLIHAHQNSEIAAEAADSAAAQGKFWQMHELLFANQDELTAPQIEYYASEVPGLDTKRFKRDFESHKYAAQVKHCMDLGNAIKLASTPTFILRKGSAGKCEYFIGENSQQAAPWDMPTPGIADLVTHPRWPSDPVQPPSPFVNQIQ
jgi:protein-disulfide isomerase